MGITIWLEDWKREPLGDVLGDPTNVLHRLLPLAGHDQGSLLGYVDWYGATVFNHAQMRHLRQELADLAPLCVNELEHDLITQIAGLVEAGVSAPLQYLVFDGD